MTFQHIDADAWSIVEPIIQGTGNGVLSGDYDFYSGFFRIPFTIQTDLGEVQVESHDQHREMFDRVRWRYRALKVTGFKRRILAAHKFANDQMLCVHESELLSGDKVVNDSIKVLSTLSEIEGHWLIIDSRYAVGNSINLNRALYGPRFSEVEQIARDAIDPTPLR